LPTLAQPVGLIHDQLTASCYVLDISQAIGLDFKFSSVDDDGCCAHAGQRFFAGACPGLISLDEDLELSVAAIAFKNCPRLR
jgi:hypothetical protein